MAHFTHCAQCQKSRAAPRTSTGMPAREFFQEKNGRTKIELRERGLLEQARAPPARFREQAPGSICKPSGQETSPKNNCISRSRGIAAEDDRQLRDGFQRESQGSRLSGLERVIRQAKWQPANPASVSAVLRRMRLSLLGGGGGVERTDQVSFAAGSP